MRQEHSDHIKALALSLYDDTRNIREVSRRMGLPRSTVQEWVNGQVGVNKDVQTERTDSNRELIERYRENALKALTTAADKYAESSASELHSLAGDSVGKIERLTGAVSALEAEQERERVAEIVQRNITDITLRDKILAELDNPDAEVLPNAG